MDTVEHFTQAYRCWEALTKFTKSILEDQNNLYNSSEKVSLT